MTPTILHADDDMIIVNKPAGLLSVPGRAADNKDCLVTRLQANFPDALTVHRLDMATSGLMVLARGAEAHRMLSKAFAERRVVKRYLAVVAGEAPDEGVVDLPLICDWPNRPRQMVSHEFGKPSLTRFRTLERGQGVSRVELEPVTGRSHQLRVHMAQIGHPILGDEFYAPPEIASARPRLLLHAWRLMVPHPATREVMVFESPAPF